MSEPIHVEHNVQTQCFSTVVDGYTAILEYRAVDDKTLDMHHTFVPNELRGKGVAAVLAKEALAYAKDQGCKVIPSCSYIAVYLQRHPQ
ncbi:MAG: GNAT family N-acetyltransferase [Pseudomonas sp.]|nr:GNAT family N-acetyltransferase [Pseudomonas sp.]